MQISITEFYNVRHLKQNQIPISTAVWDQTWFHDHKGDDYCFIDKNNVMNGIREPILSPYKLDSADVCVKQCPHKLEVPDCPFLIKYEQYLNTLDFGAVMVELRHVADEVRLATHYEGEPEIVLLVYEKPRNPCSERHALKRWFGKHDVEVKDLEFTKTIEASLF